MITLPTGIHPNVPRLDYDLLLDRVNYSTLKILGQQSPQHYKHAIDTRPTTREQLEATEEQQETKQKDALLTGEAVHVAALEPDLYGGHGAEPLDPTWDLTKPLGAGRFIVFDGTRDERHKRYQAVLARAAVGRHKVLTKAMDATAKAIARAIRSNLDVAPYIAGGHRELTVCWDYVEPQVAALDGWLMPMRCRIDYLTDVAIIDLKSTKSARPEEFAKQMWNQGCFVQAALQQDAVAAVTRRIRPYYWLAVEKEPPYAAALYEPDRDDLERARSTYRDWLRQLHRCQEEKIWPGYTCGGPMVLQAPRWARPREEEFFE